LIVRLAAGLCLGGAVERVDDALAAGSVARTLLVALGGPTGRDAVHAVEQALVVSADHELNASAFAARVAASAGADLYACVSAALATMSGPRHGGMCDRVEALVVESGRPERARAVIHERARRGERLPGFGHPLYPAGDPRTATVLAATAALGKRRPAHATLLALLDAAAAAGREPPTLDAGLCAITFALGLPRGSGAALFAIGRAAGWIAHVLEQRTADFLLRPRARYVGP
jgi:citrate synthase